MSSTQNRLATGKKVNSALDNPTNFFTASSLNSRAGDMNALLDGMANGIQTLEAADNGLQAITKTLESMQSTLRQARQDKSFETKSFDMTALSQSTTLAGTEQLSFVGGAGLNSTIDLTKAGSVTQPASAASTAVGTSVALPDQASGASQTSTISLTGLQAALAGAAPGTEQISVNDGSGGAAIDVDIATGAGAAADVDALLAEINGQLTTANIEAFDDGGNLAFRTKTGGEGETTGFGVVTGSASVNAGDFTAAIQGADEGTIDFSVQGPGDTVATPVSVTRSQIDAASGATDAEKLAAAINTTLGSTRAAPELNESVRVPKSTRF
ncbi:hypothetical protein [Pelagibacterium luteolum]